ncbi:MAG: hypothetical protein LBO05_13920 [Deltaproteobacteria bacterium]|jgi:hypothetical protein|nr:hypothetical protein [Deltaproteobacteria bacterium]
MMMMTTAEGRPDPAGLSTSSEVLGSLCRPAVVYCAAVDVTSGIANKYLTRFSEWDGLKTVVSITGTSTVKKTGVSSMTDRCYITNIDPDPKKILAIRLNHWKVETTHFFL